MSRTIPPQTCKMCSTFSGPFWNGFCPSCLDDACLNGAGEDVGLFAVREDEYDDVVMFMVQHEQDHRTLMDDCMICQLREYRCSECNIVSSEMNDQDDDDHLVAQGVVLIGCEGYHTSVFRLANQEIED